MNKQDLILEALLVLLKDKKGGLEIWDKIYAALNPPTNNLSKKRQEDLDKTIKDKSIGCGKKFEKDGFTFHCSEATDFHKERLCSDCSQIEVSGKWN